MAKRFDLVVIGTGAAGATAAHKCRAAGLEVAIVDSRPFGGTCALRGCDPKKVLVGAAEVVHRARSMEGNGIPVDSPRIEWGDLMRFKRTFTEPVSADRERRFSRAGIATFHGRARFLDGGSIQIGNDTLEAGSFLVAAGAKPAPLDVTGEEYLMTSDRFLELEQLPERIAFVGGGYVSFEFAHIAARAGAKPRIFHRGARPLGGFDPDLVDRLVEASRQGGVEIHLNAGVEAVERDGDGHLVTVSEGGAGSAFPAELVVHGAGRVPEIDDLDLGAAGIERDAKGVVVNEYLQSVSNAAVYAAGDAASTEGLPLTPVAAMEGHVVASNLLGGNHRQPDYAGVPTVVFTLPSLARVGLLEDEARGRGLRFAVKHEDTADWYSSRRVGEQHSAFKVLEEEESGRILGAHLLGPHAEEVINLFALALRAGLRAEDLQRVPWAYPTGASDVPHMV